MTSADAIEVPCPQCKNLFRVKAKALGRTVKCPKCQFGMVVEQSTISLEDELPQPSDAGLGFLTNQQKNVSPTIPPPIGTYANTTSPEPPRSEGISLGFNVALSPRKATFMPRRYRALEMVRIILFCMAILVTVGWIVWTIGTFLGTAGVIASTPSTPLGQWSSDIHTGVSPFTEEPTDAQREAILENQSQRMVPTSPGFAATFGLVVWLGVTLFSIIAIVALCSYAELIKVAVDIQENTQRSAHLLIQRPPQD